MNLHQLELFLAVAEAGTITGGADRAAISQPAVSRAIADLESSLGQRLFDRGPKGVSPTDAGQLLLTYARRIFALEQEASEALADLQGLEAGSLSIGASTTVGDYLLPAPLAAFHRAFPRIRLTLEVANTDVIQDGVFSGRFDVGFTEGEPDVARFEVRILAEDRLVVIAPPSHPLQGRPANLSQLANFPIVMREQGSGTRSIVEAGFREAGVEPAIACSLGSTTAIKKAVSEGAGLGIVSILTVQGEVDRGELILVETPLRLTRRLHIVRLGWRGESAALRQFMTILSDSLK